MKNMLTETHKEYKERKLKERKKIARLERKKNCLKKKKIDGQLARERGLIPVWWRKQFISHFSRGNSLKMSKS